MKRHEVDAVHISNVYKRHLNSVDRAFETISRHPDNLSSLFRNAQTAALAGGVIDSDSPELSYVIRLGARAGAGVFAFARTDFCPEVFKLTREVAVSYSQTTDESLVNILNWVKVFHFVTVARQADAFAVLNDIPYQLLMHSSTRSRGQSDLGYRIIDIYKSLWTNPGGFTSHPVFVEFEQFCRSGPNGTAPNKYVERMTAPQLHVMRQLQSGDSASFTQALTEALKLHKKHWSSTEQLRKDFEGFVSLPLTAIAALAWDRGMRFQVESDYLPWSWVTGEIFQPA